MSADTTNDPKQQWHERSIRSLAVREMSEKDMEQLRRVMVQSYNCLDTDITFSFEKIRDENDVDRDSCIWITYWMDCIQSGKPTKRNIFRMKILLPARIREKAESMNKTTRRPMQRRDVNFSTAGMSPSTAPITIVRQQPQPDYVVVDETDFGTRQSYKPLEIMPSEDVEEVTVSSRRLQIGAMSDTTPAASPAPTPTKVRRVVKKVMK